MPVRTMRQVEPGRSRWTAAPPSRTALTGPVFRGNGEYDYVCGSCGNVLAAGMDPQYMTRRVRVKCGRCRTVNIAAEVSVQAARRPRPSEAG